MGSLFRAGMTVQVVYNSVSMHVVCALKNVVTRLWQSRLHFQQDDFTPSQTAVTATALQITRANSREDIASAATDNGRAAAEDICSCWRGPFLSALQSSPRRNGLMEPNDICSPSKPGVQLVARAEVSAFSHLTVDFRGLFAKSVLPTDLRSLLTKLEKFESPRAFQWWGVGYPMALFRPLEAGLQAGLQKRCLQHAKTALVLRQ